MSSSDPSKLFVMQHFLNNCRGGPYLTLPAGVVIVSKFGMANHFLYSRCKYLLKGLFIDTLSGCSWDVMPPGITTISRLRLRSLAFTESVVCPLKASTTSMHFLNFEEPSDVALTRLSTNPSLKEPLSLSA